MLTIYTNMLQPQTALKPLQPASVCDQMHHTLAFMQLVYFHVGFY